MAQVMKPRTRLAREERREQIVDAAIALFAGRDPAGVTFEEIADAAGVSRALVYNYFGDRHGLVEAMYCRSVDELDRRVGDALSATRGLRDALAASVRVHLTFAAEAPAAYRHAAGDIAFPRQAELEALRVEKLAGAFGGTTQATLLARGVLSSVQDMVLWWMDRGDVEHDDALKVISSYLNGGIAAVRALGVSLTPTWPVPV